MRRDSSGIVVPKSVVDLNQYQYHDHTADIIVHSWGKTRAEAFAQSVVGMFNYMTEVENIEMVQAVDVEAKGHDLLDLLYHLLDEFLFVFGDKMHVSRCVEILEFDEADLRIRARGYGERMDIKAIKANGEQKHKQGTEIKAITMHMMRILDSKIVISEKGSFDREDFDNFREDLPHETYALLDI